MQKLKPIRFTNHVGNIGANKSKTFKLSKTPGKIQVEFPISMAVGSVVPGMIVTGGTAVVTDFSATVSQPKNLKKIK